MSLNPKLDENGLPLLEADLNEKIEDSNENAEFELKFDIETKVKDQEGKEQS